MHQVIIPFLALVFFLGLSPARSQQRPLELKDCAGSWTGQLKIQSQQLKLDMNITVNEADSVTVTFDSPDQGVLDLPTDKVMVEGDSLFVSLKPIGGYYSGKVNKAVDTVRGAWKQGGMSFPLTMTRQGQRAALNRPQEPAPPFPYYLEEVVFPGPDGSFTLAGTLTRPDKPGRFPVAVMVTGSGAQNRDEELLGHKPFLVIADFLTRQGFAVLRFDDRGTGKSGGDFGKATTLDFAADASAAVDFLKNRPDIDTSRIGIIGHSEGGLIAPILASARNDIAFIVMLAGPGIRGDRLLLLQAKLIAGAEGIDSKVIRDNETMSRDIYNVLLKTSDTAKAVKKVRILLEDFNKKQKGGAFSLSPEQIDQQVKIVTTPWFRTFLQLDPETYLVKVKCPVLALNGSLDLQVPSTENLQAIEKALIFGGNSSYIIEELKGLNHLFQTAVSGSPSEYGKIEETFAPGALEFIARWMKKNTERP